MKKIALVLILTILILAVPVKPALAIALKDVFRIATGTLTAPFGGKILIKTYQVCLIPAPPPINVIPLPFIYLEVGDPKPASLYYLFGISRLYLQFQMEVTSWSKGLYWIEADDAFRAICINRAALPDADGVIQKIGTSFPTGDIF